MLDSGAACSASAYGNFVEGGVGSGGRPSGTVEEFGDRRTVDRFDGEICFGGEVHHFAFIVQVHGVHEIAAFEDLHFRIARGIFDGAGDDGLATIGEGDDHSGNEGADDVEQGMEDNGIKPLAHGGLLNLPEGADGGLEDAAFVEDMLESVGGHGDAGEDMDMGAGLRFEMFGLAGETGAVKMLVMVEDDGGGGGFELAVKGGEAEFGVVPPLGVIAFEFIEGVA